MKSLCSYPGCEKPVVARSLCALHYQRLRKNGDASITRRAASGSGWVNADGYVRRKQNSVTKFEHVAIAERALGRPLPNGVVVHHANENRRDNRPENLVICTLTYHALIHKRMRALAACGNANWLKCPHCKQYDDPANLLPSGRHRDCQHNYDQRYYREIRKPKRIGATALWLPAAEEAKEAA